MKLSRASESLVQASIWNKKITCKNKNVKISFTCTSYESDRFELKDACAQPFANERSFVMWDPSADGYGATETSHKGSRGFRLMLVC